MPWTKILVDKQALVFNNLKHNAGRQLSFAQAILEGLDQALALDDKVYIMGQGVDDPSGIFGTTLNLHKKYGRKRVFDTPLSENGITGVAIGSALTGLRPVYIHNRPDFLLLCMDQIVNHAAKWKYMFGGSSNVPIVIRAVIGRGWGSAAQHSQSLCSLFMHIPGLKVVAPASPYDAKGLLLASIADNSPVIFIEHRWLYKSVSYVPRYPYYVPLGKAVVRKTGKDVTIVCMSYMVMEAMDAAYSLENQGIDVEVIDVMTARPLDVHLIISSIKKTGRLIITDVGWKTVGLGSEVAARVLEESGIILKCPLIRICPAECPTPASHVLEAAYYPNSNQIIDAVKKTMAF